MAGEHSRAPEFHRAERHPHFRQRPAPPSGEFEECPRSGIPWSDYPGGCGARPHSQDSRANPVGCCRSQWSRGPLGNEEIYALLPYAKTWNLTFQPGSPSRVTALPSFSGRSLRMQSANHIAWTASTWTPCLIGWHAPSGTCCSAPVFSVTYNQRCLAVVLPISVASLDVSILSWRQEVGI